MDKKQHHILPIGRWKGKVHKPGPNDPTELVQVVTADDVATLARVLNERAQDPNWPGILLDVDHESEAEDKRSEAAGWYKGPFVVKNDGLWAGVELTPLGEELIGSKKYKRLSPTPSLVPNAAGEYHPVDIASVALTNRPRMRELTLVTNSEDAKVLTIETQAQEVKVMNEELLKLLGLPQAATEAEAIAAVKVLNQTVADYKTRELELAADAFVAEHGDKFADPAKARELYVQNAETAKAFAAQLKAIPAAPAAPAAPATTVEEPAKVLNRADASTPGPVLDADKQSPAQAADSVKVLNRTRELQDSKGLSFAVAWERATAEISGK